MVVMEAFPPLILSLLPPQIWLLPSVMKLRVWLCIPCTSDITSVSVYSGAEESSTEIQQEKGTK